MERNKPPRGKRLSIHLAGESSFLTAKPPPQAAKVQRFRNRIRVFVDSNVFIGIFNKDDALHKKALTLWDGLKKEDALIVVSNFIISEVITVLSQRVGKQLALEFAFSIYFNEKEEVELVRMDERCELLTLEYFTKISSKNVSFTDVSILAILEIYHIEALASFDNFFKQQKGIKLIS